MTEEKTAVAPKTPAVYEAVANILKALSVEKGGSLPANMGGKPYITAVDLSLEIKRQFVENNLILVPTERVVKHEAIAGTRMTIAIMIEGTYHIVSTVDGSSITIGGSGDGLALGTAVASNIASTNALKNALLRTFLVTEQSVEDAAKEALPEEKPEAKKTAAQVKKEESADEIKAKIGAIIGKPDSPYDNETVNALGNQLSGKPVKVWFANPTDLQKVLDAMNNGQLPD